MKGKFFFTAPASLLISSSLFAQPIIKKNLLLKTTLTKLFVIAALLLGITKVQAQTSGTTGPLSWAVSSDNTTLTISGNGAMPDYQMGIWGPWLEPFYEYITTIVIEEGVTTIGNYAFYGIGQLTSVTIPNSVTSIGEYAFCYCTKLTSVNLPQDLTHIGMGAFFGCQELASITLPEKVTTIGNDAFYECSALSSITIPNSVTSLGDDVFNRCSSLASVTIGSSITSIGGNAFYGCNALTRIKMFASAPPAIPNFTGVDQANCVLYVPTGAIAAYRAAALWQNFATINEFQIVDSGTAGALTWVYTSDGTLTISGTGDMPNYSQYGHPAWAVYRNSITEVEITYGVTSIGDYAFFYEYGYSNYPSLKQVFIPNGVTRIGVLAFDKSTALTSVIIPNSVTSIGHSAFSECEALTSINIPNGITSLESYIFINCKALTSITIPNSVTSIRTGAFSACTALTSITIPNSVTSIGSFAFYNCTALTSITIPNSVTSMEEGAFYRCIKLASVTIGSGITYFGDFVFRECALTKLSAKALTPNVLIGEPLYDLYSSCVLEVPFGSKNLYRATEGWKYFATINEIVDPNLASSVVSASVASSTSLTINGRITNSSTESKSANMYFIYGTDPNNLNQTTTMQGVTVPGSGSLNVSTTITGLTNGTLYYYKLVAGGNESSVGKLFLSTSIPVSNLKLWLRSDQAVTSSGSSVSGWGDLSNSNNDASQSTSGNQPAITSSAINGYPALSFNGTTSKLTLPTSVSLGMQNNPYEVFIVAKSSLSNVQFLIAGAATEQFEYHLNGAVGARFIPASSVYIDQGLAGAYTNGNAHVFSARTSASGGVVRVDGNDVGTTGVSTLSSNSGNLLLGARSDGSYYFDGYIAEVIIYNTNLSSEDRSTVEQYLADRYGITSGALPVELTSFTANSTDGKVLLNWQTVTEVNNYGFEVERASTSLGMTWEKIGFVQGHGNSNSPKNYSFTDNLALAHDLNLDRISYRLKQIDFDGKFEYSNIVEVKVDIPKQFKLSQNYPNPFNPTTTIKYSIPNAETIRRFVSTILKIYDILGREVATLVNEQQAPGNYEVKFDGSKLASGVYIYQLVSGSFTQTKKLLLMK